VKVSYFSKEQIGIFEKLLQGQRQQLMEDAGRTVSKMTDKEATFADPADRASWESEANRDLRIRDRERKLIDKIEGALERISDETFGECEECGEMISLGRLKARPVTTMCISCKAEQEEAEHRPNHRH